MVITCPACSTRYLVDPRALGAGGRVVRCANCSHTWHQELAANSRAADDLASPVLTAPAESEARGEEGPGGQVQLPALAGQGRGIPALGWALYGVFLVVLFLGGLWFTRDQMVAYWPGLARYYQMAGLSVAQGMPALDIKVSTPTYDTENGLPTLVIEGEVVNQSKVTQQVPKLRIILRDKDHHELQSWVFSVSDMPLMPGSSVPFRTSVSQPNEQATGVLVVPGDGG